MSKFQWKSFHMNILVSTFKEWFLFLHKKDLRNYFTFVHIPTKPPKKEKCELDEISSVNRFNNFI